MVYDHRKNKLVTVNIRVKYSVKPLQPNVYHNSCIDIIEYDLYANIS